MDWLIPLLVIDKLPRSQRAAVAEQLLPVALPGSSSQRLAIAAITAEQQIRRENLADKSLVQEVVDNANVKDAQDLARAFPQVNRAFTRLPPALQAQIVFKSESPAVARIGVQGSGVRAATQAAATRASAAQSGGVQPAVAPVASVRTAAGNRRPGRAAAKASPGP